MWLKPAGTTVCLRDNSDFKPGTDVTLPNCHGFKVGDEIEFLEDGDGTQPLAVGSRGHLDSAITTAIALNSANVSGPFVITSIDTKASPNTFKFATKAVPGTNITLLGDGGKGTPVGGVPATFTPVTALPTTNGTYGADETTSAVATETNGNGRGLTVDVVKDAAGNVAAIGSITVNAGGTGYKVGDEITIKGDALGGTATSPANDIKITVATASAITGGGDNDLPRHIEVRMTEHQVVCQVANFSLSLERDEIETTSLPCTTGGNAGCLAPFKTKQSGFAEGSGSMEINFTPEQSTLANRLIADSLKKDQNGASVRLFINTVSGANAGEVDLSQSLYIEAPIVILGFSIDVSPEEAITAEVDFSFSGQPSHLFTAL